MGDDRALTILLVDDDEVDVMTVKRAFTKANITNKVYVATNGVEALEMLRGDQLPMTRRIILLDLNMPRMNGIEFLREIRKDPALAHLTVVVLTTSNEDRDRVEAFQLNVAGYLLKPVTFSDFAEVMATWGSAGDPPWLVSWVELSALMAIARGEAATGTTWLASAERARALGLPRRLPYLQRQVESAQRQARATLGVTAFRARWAEGELWPRERALAAARAWLELALTREPATEELMVD